jgi:hypothetical protein
MDNDRYVKCCHIRASGAVGPWRSDISGRAAMATQWSVVFERLGFVILATTAAGSIIALVLIAELLSLRTVA